MIDELTFLEDGPFTKRDALSGRIVKELKCSGIPIRKAISQYVSNLRLDESEKEKLLRKRNSSEILDSRFVTGCTDIALVFTVLARESGIPTRFVDTFYEPWINCVPSKQTLRNANAFRKQYSNFLEEMDYRLKKGLNHQDAEKIVYEEWMNFCNDSSVPIELIENLLRRDMKIIESHVFVDVFADGWRPYGPKTGFVDGYCLLRGKYIEVGKGLDFSVIYIKENEKYRDATTNLQSFDESLRLFKPDFFK